MQAALQQRGFASSSSSVLRVMFLKRRVIRPNGESISSSRIPLSFTHARSSDNLVLGTQRLGVARIRSLCFKGVGIDFFFSTSASVAR